MSVAKSASHAVYVVLPILFFRLAFSLLFGKYCAAIVFLPIVFSAVWVYVIKLLVYSSVVDIITDKFSCEFM